MSHSGPIWSTLGPNLAILQPVLCSTESSCGRKLLGPDGVIKSPNYPDNYDTDTTCVYVISVDLNFVVQLTFEDFQTEQCNMLCDGVKVRSSSDIYRGVGFGSKVGWNGPKILTNPGFFQIRFQNIFAQRTKMF